MTEDVRAESTDRQREILSAALDLFDERGFHATGVGDIGRAIGVTAGALYKHFSSKSEILARAMALAAETLDRGVDEAADLPPREALRRLIANHVEVSVSESRMIKVWLHEQRNAPDLRWARDVQRKYIEAWVRALSRVSPQLPYSEARTRVQAALSLILSAALYPRAVERDDLKRMLNTFAWTVCTDEMGT
jgi:AcrR family transcriptional regulator